MQTKAFNKTLNDEWEPEVIECAFANCSYWTGNLIFIMTNSNLLNAPCGACFSDNTKTSSFYDRMLTVYIQFYVLFS